MKTFVLLIISVCIAFTGISQNRTTQKNKAKIVVNKQFDFGETYRTYSITQLNFVDAKSKFIKRLGKPKINNLGMMQWTNVSIPEIGEQLTFTLQDGVVEINPEGVTYTVYTNKKLKTKALQNLSATKFRMLSFKITNSENINVIRNNNTEEAGLLFLESLEL